MRHLILLAAAAGLSACATEVIGPYAKSLSPEDAQQIQALVSARPDIYHKCVVYIHATRPDCLFVETTPTVLGGLLKTTFIACKRRGTWVINERSVQHYDEVIVTE